MAQRLNPPPNWPTPPEGWVPSRTWRPDPAWGPPPHGWKLWIEDGGYGIDDASIRVDKPKRPRKSMGCLFFVLAFVAVLIGVAVLSAKSYNESMSAPAGSRSGTEASANGATAAQIESATEMTDRDLALLVKNPDGSKGKTVVIYADITQFDAATGTCIFRASIAHAPREYSYQYTSNSLFTGGDGEKNCPDLAGLVEGDIVRVTATSTGAYSYDTQIGGNTTASSFRVEKISRVG